MDRKIIFLDLDGTLTNDKKEVTPKTLKALKKVQKEGHIVALASGRPTPGMDHIAEILELDKYGGYVMSFNGGKIIDWKTKETIFQNVMPKKYIKPLLKYANTKNIGLLTYDEKQVLVGTRMDKYIKHESFINKIPTSSVDMVKDIDYDPNKCLMTAEPEKAKECEKELSDMFDGKLSVYRSAPYFIEVVPKGIDKATSIKRLINHLKIDRKNTIACGDGFNDLSMIKYAGVGVAMKNGEEVVKEAADYITASNNNDGIAQVVEMFMTA